jgi:hypothetical protein
VTTENNLPRPGEPGISVGGMTLTPPTQSGVTPTSIGGFQGQTPRLVRTSQKSKLRDELNKLSARIDALDPGTPEYNKTVKRYKELKRQIEQMEQADPAPKQVQTAVEIRKQLQRAKDKGLAQEEIDTLETRLAEAEKNAVATIKPDDKLRQASPASGANSGYLPNKDKSQIIFNPGTGTITVVDKVTGEPVTVTKNNVNVPLSNVYLVVDEKKFYERGVESSVREVQYISEPDLIQSAYSLSKNERKRLQEDMKRVGILDKNFKANGDFDLNGDFINGFLNAHRAANQVNFNNLQNNLPVKGVLQAYQELQDTQTAAAQPTVTRSVSIPNREAAAEQLNNLYMSSVGRKATDKEIDEFYKKVRSTAKSRPTVTTATPGKTGTGEGNSYSTQEGFTTDVLQSMARETAEARPEFLAYQLSTNFYDALLGASQLPIATRGIPASGSLEQGF